MANNILTLRDYDRASDPPDPGSPGSFSGPAGVVVTGVQIPFGAMVGTALKWGLACLIAGGTFALAGGLLYFIGVQLLAKLAS